MPNTYYVYIISNRYRSVLYIGMTNNLPQRVQQHQEGRGGAFAARYRATHLIYFEEYRNINAAIKREKQLKGWTRDKKLRLIRRQNPDLDSWNHHV